jgi:hypothetical protein
VINLSGILGLNVYLMFFAEELDMSLYGIRSSLTVPGWIFIAILLSLAVYIIGKGLRNLIKNKEKLK